MSQNGLLLITANVGSLFEDIDGLSHNWTEELLSTVARTEPKFIALHCQEVGGKNYEKCMTHIHTFVSLLLSSPELSEYSSAAIIIDEDFTATDKFTALGNLYFIHKSIDAKIWNFLTESYDSIIGHRIFAGNIEELTIKIKCKFPQDFFPDFKWSRKGFMKTRWSIDGQIVDMTNVHLYHDESNYLALKSYPSPYAENRRKALEYTLELSQCNNQIPQFIFGDFNFRLDMLSVLRSLIDCNISPDLPETVKCHSNTEIIFKSPITGLEISIKRKQFALSQPDYFASSDNLLALLQHDREPEYYDGRLFELPIGFVPSYPFTETRNHSRYMSTRCPAWCDRVLMNSVAKQLLDDGQTLHKHKPDYDLLGVNTSMGDHKPVYLMFQLPAPVQAPSTPTKPNKSKSALVTFYQSSKNLSNKASKKGLNDDTSHHFTVIDLNGIVDQSCPASTRSNADSNDSVSSVSTHKHSNSDATVNDSCRFCFCNII